MTDLPVQKTHISLDDLLEMPERAEIINGELVEMSAAGVLHGIIIGNIYRIVDPYVMEHEIGTVLMDGVTYLMYSDPRSLKDSFIPDLSFIRNENIPSNFDVSKPHPGIPDLAVEVVSPNDKAVDVQDKILAYLDKGTEQAWVAYPEVGSQSLHQYVRGSSTIRIYQEPDEAIDTSAIFPDLQGLTVAAIFKLPKWAEQQIKSD
jgi:Uma2 family endonuclease